MPNQHRSARKTCARSRVALLCTVATLLAACGGSQPPPAPAPREAAVYRFPWLEECKDRLEQHFAAERKRNPDFSYRMVPFSRSLNPLPTLRGYVELFSGSGNLERLSAVADEVVPYCYPTTVRKIALQDRQFQTKLEQTRLLARREGASDIYARLTQDSLHLYFPETRTLPR